MRKRPLLTGALAVSLTVLPASGVLAADPPDTPDTIPDVTVLFGRALTKVRNTSRPTFARAVVLEADGMTRGGRCGAGGCVGGWAVTSAGGVVGWRFVFDNSSSSSRFASATITYGPPPKTFGKVVGNPQPFLEDVRIPKAPRMTLAQAVTLLRRAGHRAGFVNVTLRNPLGPKASNPLYIFGFANGPFIGVDTVTKKVTRLS